MARRRRRRRTEDDPIPADEAKDDLFTSDLLSPWIWWSDPEGPDWGPFEDEEEARAYWREHRDRLLEESDGRPWPCRRWEN